MAKPDGCRSLPDRLVQPLQQADDSIQMRMGL